MIFLALITGLAFILAGCPAPLTGTDVPAPIGASGVPVPSDTTNDVSRSISGPFTFETVYTVDLDLAVELYETDENGFVTGGMLPPEEARVFVELTDDEGNTILTGRFSAEGTLRTAVQLPAAPADVTMTLNAPGFESRSLVIRDMVTLERVVRTLSMRRVVSASGSRSLSATSLQDSDDDGVADEFDAFPDDPELAFRTNLPSDGEITVAFEDLFGRSRAGDADYNDFIATYTITEAHPSEDSSLVKSIVVNATAQTKLAGYNHRFGIRIDAFSGSATLSGTYIDERGREVAMRGVVSAPAEIDLFLNSRYAVGKSASFTLTFDTAQDRENALAGERLPEAPYNPYIVVDRTRRDIHLINREPNTGSINAGDDFVDADNFPWALLVPATWNHPEEAERIEGPYPRFTLWRESGGIDHADWYLYEDQPYVPEEPTPTTPTVYVAGYYTSEARQVAAYWELPSGGGDPVVVPLTDGVPTGVDAQANDVFVAGDDVYVAGFLTDGSVRTAVSWRNGVATVLSQPGENAEATGIYVEAGTVYVSGIVRTSAGSLPVYWRNGVREDLSATATSTSAAHAIVADGGLALVAGEYNDGTVPFTATLWRDEAASAPQITDLAAGTNTEAFAVTIGSDGDYYVAGSFFNGASFASAYWTVDAATLVATRTDVYSVAAAGSWSKAFGVDEESGAVYTAGYYTSGGELPAYWSGTTLVSLPVASSGRALDIDVEGTEVYVAGFSVDSGVSAATLWVNGASTPLASGGAEARSVFVDAR